jgi:hypothetical protein
MSDAAAIGKDLIEPVIYRALADRVALLQKPQVTVEFHMRVSEAKSNLNAIAVRAASLNPSQAAAANIQPGHIAVVADSLITALQLAHEVVSETFAVRSTIDEQVQKMALREIEAAVTRARQAFPNAEAFKVPLSWRSK